jgi:hypothetical protein
MTPPLSANRLREAAQTLSRFIEARYAVPIVITDVPNPFRGDLDGARILVKPDLEADETLFLIAHLFGHTVQWNLDARAREIGAFVQASPSEERLQELETYERDACRYSLWLLHEAGIHDLDQWLADFAACDFAFLRHFYATGERRPFRSFWRESQPPLSPLPVPPFQPTQWKSRYEGIVV